ncbi:glycosyltransferase family 39 protein [Candidatus Woesearchaeota archaeon]|nr:glycosyltransferase family 39 protein [Candidatus Woesearchaeota archaeon]
MIKPLLLLFFLAVIVRVVFFDASYAFWDESVYLLHGKLIAGEDVGYSEAFLRPPLLPLLLSPFASLASYEAVSRFLLAFLNSLVVLPVFFLAAAVFNRRTAFLSAAVIAILPLHILNSRWVMTDALGALLAFSAVIAYFFGLQQQRKLLVYFGGILTGLAILMKFTNLLLLPLLLPLFFFHWKRLSVVVVSLLLAAAVVAPYLLYSQSQFGSPFYTFGRAFHVVAEAGSSGPAFFLYLFSGSLGFFLVFLALGVVEGFRLRLQQNNARLYLLYCLAVSGAYAFFIVGRGVAKPLGIEWESARFFLLPILFAAPFIGFGISRFVNALPAFFARILPARVLASIGRFQFPVLAAATILVAVAALPLQVERTYAPSIAFEDGLRQSTKDLGLYLRGSEISEFACLGNCPPVAYYSGKKMAHYYSLAELSRGNHGSVVVFNSAAEVLSSEYEVEKGFCSGSHCAYLLSRFGA